ncbi:MAG: hypothetical protein KTV77_03295 [Wolbachia endosymbiont of Fragariocoptes setiger]|nr:hypothetical protein [Wolbachia endosymbiont of Fragariocoptes setiger]
MTNYLEKIKTQCTNQYNSTYDWVKNNQWKAGAIGFVVSALTFSAIACYFSPRYASFVGAYVSKVSGFVAPALAAVSSGITAGFTFAASHHPIVFATLAAAVVATLITLAVKNHDKNQEIKNINENINQALKERNGQVVVKDVEKAKALLDNAKTSLTDVETASLINNNECSKTAS